MELLFHNVYPVLKSKDSKSQCRDSKGYEFPK